MYDIKRYRLHSMPKAQCHVKIVMDGNLVKEVSLISYETLVLTISMGGDCIACHCTGLYSCTTSRHINRFTREFLGENHYFTCKEALIKNNGFFTVEVTKDVCDAYSNSVLNYLSGDYARPYFYNYSGVKNIRKRPYTY